jgi:hypothetical protein
VDADDRAAKPLFVRTHLCGEICERRLASELAAQHLARSLELATLAAHAARPGSLRSASIMAPRMRRSAKVSNLIPRDSSKRSAASINPMTPSWMRSPMSIE